MSTDIEKELHSVVNDGVDLVNIRNKKYKIRWIKPGTQRKLSETITKYKDDDTLQYRCASLCILNNYFKILFFQWFLWRWFFFIKEYSPGEMKEVFEVSKKKIPQVESLLNMVLILGVTDMLKSQTMTFAKDFLQKQNTEQSTQ